MERCVLVCMVLAEEGTVLISMNHELMVKAMHLFLAENFQKGITGSLRNTRSL